MGRRKTYGSIDIKSLDAARLLAAITSAIVVSVDVAKAAFVAAISTAADGLVRLIRFEHPRETQLFLDLIVKLKTRAELRVLMEPTGTYGDAIRHQLDQLKIEVRMIQPKHTHDAKEAFDGAPSMHDPKAAVVMIKLHNEGASRVWRSSDPARRSLRALFDQHVMLDRGCDVLQNQIEARVNRHWPEFEEWLSLREHVSARALLEQFPGPRLVAQDPERARSLLVRASRGGLSPELIAALVESAQRTLGVPMIEEEEDLLKVLVTRLQLEMRGRDALESRVEKLVDADASIQRMKVPVGIMAAAAIATYLGSPTQYHCSNAMLKAAGLNLVEISSGTEKGPLHISKRGPSIVRKLLYLAALRASHRDPVVRAWYQARRAFHNDDKSAAVVAVMRKLLEAAYYVSKHDVAYDPARLFDTRRLMLPAASETQRRSKPKPRTQPRSIARRTKRHRAISTGGATM